MEFESDTSVPFDNQTEFQTENRQQKCDYSIKKAYGSKPPYISVRNNKKIGHFRGIFTSKTRTIVLGTLLLIYVAMPPGTEALQPEPMLCFSWIELDFRICPPLHICNEIATTALIPAF